MSFSCPFRLVFPSSLLRPPFVPGSSFRGRTGDEPRGWGGCLLPDETGHRLSFVHLSFFCFRAGVSLSLLPASLSEARRDLGDLLFGRFWAGLCWGGGISGDRCRSFSPVRQQSVSGLQKATSVGPCLPWARACFASVWNLEIDWAWCLLSFYGVLYERERI